MPKRQDDAAAQAIDAILEQAERLKGIYEDYYSAFDAAFDPSGAAVSIARWHDRTCRILSDCVSEREAARFRTMLSISNGFRRVYQFEECVNQLHTYLLRLAEDIEDHPDDARYERLTAKPSQKPPASKAQPRNGSVEYDVFLSYSTVDKDEARVLHEGLRRQRKTCFIAEKSLKPGDVFRDEIRNALNGSKEVWILVSPNSNKSAWVQAETAAAWGMQKRVVPILLRCPPDDLPELVGGIHAIDYHKVIQQFRV